MAYTSTGTGTTWLPTGALSDTSSGPDFIPAVGPGGTVIAVGYTNRTNTSQQALFVKADTAGHVQPVSLAAIPGGLIPEEAVKSIAVAGSTTIAVGSADGYPAVWRSVSGGAWRLVSSLTLASADPNLAGLSAVTHGPAGWLAVGTGPFVLTSADGSTWRSAGAIAHDLAGVSAVRAASGPGGYVIAGEVAQPGGGYLPDVWWSRDLTSWVQGADPRTRRAARARCLRWPRVRLASYRQAHTTTSPRCGLPTTAAPGRRSACGCRPAPRPG